MAKLSEIVSDMHPINDVLITSDIPYFIPEFQRSFVWGKEEIKQLLADIDEDTEGFSKNSQDLEGYLLGNIVLIEDEEKKQRIVVDGQQRLTTLSLIAKGLHVIVAERMSSQDINIIMTWSKVIGDINKGFSIVDENSAFKSLKIMHDPSLGFGKYYNKLIQDSALPEDIVTKEDANIDEVYTEIYDFLKDLDDQQLKKFIAYYKHKLKLIVTTAPNEAKAFQLFEILNNRGRSLEPMDLIKNLFLKRLTMEGKSDDTINTFNTNWKSLMLNLEISKKKSIPSSVFVKHYIVAVHGINLKADYLFQYFKDKGTALTGDEIMELVGGMAHASSIYAAIENGNYSGYSTNPIDDKNMYILYKILGIKQFHSLFIRFYNADAIQKSEILDHAVRMGAAILFSYNQMNRIEAFLPTILKEYNKNVKSNPSGAYSDLLSAMKAETDNYAQLARATMSERNNVGRNGNHNTKAMTVLKFIEYYFNNNDLIRHPQTPKRLTVEHILSQKIDLTSMGLSYPDLGFTDAREMSQYMHRIGNLTLLYNTDNSSVGNPAFKDKINMYRNCDFKMTKVIIEPLKTLVANGMDSALCSKINSIENSYASKATGGQWTKSLIDERSRDMANMLYKVLTKEIS